MSEFEISDSWIFLAIAQSSGGTLRDFYAVADYINVSIPNDDEIENCVNRLAACGLVEVSDNWFSITAKGRELFEEVQKLSRYPRSQFQPAASLLSSAMQSPTSRPWWRLNPDVAAKARNEYFHPTKVKPKRAAGKRRPKETVSE